MMDNLYDSQLTIQIVGNQWYWNYNYSDYDEIDNFDSYLVDESDLELGDLRMLAVDNYLVLQAKFNSLSPDRTFSSEFSITFENENYEKVYLFLNEGEICGYSMEDYKYSPYFLEIIEDSTSAKVSAYVVFSN
jgi:hypothetical protein